MEVCLQCFALLSIRPQKKGTTVLRADGPFSICFFSLSGGKTNPFKKTHTKISKNLPFLEKNFGKKFKSYFQKTLSQSFKDWPKQLISHDFSKHKQTKNLAK